MVEWQDELDEYEKSADGGSSNREDFDFQDVLHDHFDNFTWNYTGIAKDTGETIPIPKVSNCVTAIFEVDAVETAKGMADSLDASLIEPEHSRQYPDITLRGGVFGDNLVALDIKTARRKSNSDQISGMTLGSYGQYFSNPDTDTQWTRFPYGAYDEHWVVCFAYRWDDGLNSQEMVYDVETIVGQKWELASRSSGSGTTTAIGSQKSMESLVNREAIFGSEEEFEEYWQDYGND